MDEFVITFFSSFAKGNKFYDEFVDSKIIVQEAISEKLASKNVHEKKKKIMIFHFR